MPVNPPLCQLWQKIDLKRHRKWIQVKEHDGTPKHYWCNWRYVLSFLRNTNIKLYLGNHIDIRAPRKSGTTFYNYKKQTNLSIVLLGCVILIAYFPMLILVDTSRNPMEELKKKLHLWCIILGKSNSVPWSNIDL